MEVEIGGDIMEGRGRSGKILDLEDRFQNASEPDLLPSRSTSAVIFPMFRALSSLDLETGRARLVWSELLSQGPSLSLSSKRANSIFLFLYIYIFF